jgi:cyclopropane fatty-acyl-phospholipid synthase-like methyltransferase
MSSGEKIELKNLCKVCHSLKFKDVVKFQKCVFSDGHSNDIPLIKEECAECGTVRTQLKINLDEFYKVRYKPSRNIDTVAILDDKVINRSHFIYEWIVSLIEKEKLKKFKTIFEIGCGQGFLLKKFNIENKFAIEPSKEAALQASKIANVRNIGYIDIKDTEEYDFILSYCVIEHVEDPNYFLEKQYNLLNKNGLMCIALPIQDKFNYDLVFADHIHHFNHQNFIKILNKNGFSILNYELGRGSYTNIGMYICEKTTKQNVRFEYIENLNIKNTHAIITNIENIIQKYKQQNLYAFGYGEIAKTILPYSDIDKYIVNYIDDFNNEEKVIHSKEAKNIFRTLKTVNLILLVNPAHSHKIKNLFNEFKNINFINIFEDIKVKE